MRAPRPLLFLVLALACPAAGGARPDGNPNFAFQCSLGRDAVGVTTESGRLVFRLGPPARARRTIVEDPAAANVLYRYQSWSTSSFQQLRFRDGAASFVVYNFFRAADYFGRGSADRSGLLVLDGERVVARRRCRSGGHFDEDHQLDRRPADPLELPLP